MRGKQAAKARNRLAALDNEIIAEVVAERDALKAERDALTVEVAILRRDTRSEALRIGADLAHDEVAHLQTRLADEQAERASDRDRLAFEVWALFNGDLYELKSADHFEAMAEVFGMGHRLGELFTASGVTQRNRYARRATAKTSRRIEAIREENRAKGSAMQ